MQAGIEENFPLKVHLIDQTIHILALNLVQQVGQVKEANQVEGHVCNLAQFWSQVVLIETMQSLSHKVPPSKQNHPGHG